MTPAQLAMIERRIHDLRGATSPAQRGETTSLMQRLSRPLAAARRNAVDAHARALIAVTMGDSGVAAYWRARRDTSLMLAAMVER